jgi:hypothetical protein
MTVLVHRGWYNKPGLRAREEAKGSAKDSALSSFIQFPTHQACVLTRSLFARIHCLTGTSYAGLFTLPQSQKCFGLCAGGGGAQSAGGQRHRQRRRGKGTVVRRSGAVP